MKALSVYLTFPGNCEEALHFYKNCLDGEIHSLQRFGDSPMETADADKQRVMHAEFKAGGIAFMASDSMPDHPTQPGSIVQLSINLDDSREQEQIFNSLAEGGTVTFPLQETFWGAVFGMLIDKFGVHWMLNRNVQP
ncbi:MAG: VOC family protein [Bacteroidetes bacterium]|nr:MAG: VOC family protein [Bacteroidota bacterium]